MKPVPVVKAFLGWRVVDDFGETDDRPVALQAQRFLGAIYTSLAAACNKVNIDSGVQIPMNSHSPRLGRTAQPKIIVEGKTRRDVDDLGYQRTSDLRKHLNR